MDFSKPLDLSEPVILTNWADEDEGVSSEPFDDRRDVGVEEGFQQSLPYGWKKARSAMSDQVFSDVFGERSAMSMNDVEESLFQIDSNIQKLARGSGKHRKFHDRPRHVLVSTKVSEPRLGPGNTFEHWKRRVSNALAEVRTGDREFEFEVLPNGEQRPFQFGHWKNKRRPKKLALNRAGGNAAYGNRNGSQPDCYVFDGVNIRGFMFNLAEGVSLITVSYHKEPDVSFQFSTGNFIAVRSFILGLMDLDVPLSQLEFRRLLLIRAGVEPNPGPFPIPMSSGCLDNCGTGMRSGELDGGLILFSGQFYSGWLVHHGNNMNGRVMVTMNVFDHDGLTEEESIRRELESQDRFFEIEILSLDVDTFLQNVHHFNQKTSYRDAACLVEMLLMLGGVELNPGPPRFKLTIGKAFSCSCCNRIVDPLDVVIVDHTFKVVCSSGLSELKIDKSWSRGRSFGSLCSDLTSYQTLSGHLPDVVPQLVASVPASSSSSMLLPREVEEHDSCPDPVDLIVKKVPLSKSLMEAKLLNAMASTVDHSCLKGFMLYDEDINEHMSYLSQSSSIWTWRFVEKKISDIPCSVCDDRPVACRGTKRVVESISYVQYWYKMNYARWFRYMLIMVAFLPIVPLLFISFLIILNLDDLIGLVFVTSLVGAMQVIIFQFLWRKLSTKWLWVRDYYFCYCPHLLTCVYSECRGGESVEALAANVRARVLRMAALPIDQERFLPVVEGTIMAIQLLLKTRNFTLRGVI